MAITKRQLTQLAKLRKTEVEASAKRIAYQERLEAACDHTLVFEHGYGYEDTLGNFAPERGTTDWHCAMCGKRVATATGRCDRPAKVRPYILSVAGYGVGADKVRDTVLRGVPQTYDDVLETLKSKFGIAGRIFLHG